MKKWLVLCVCAAALLAGWRPAPREPEGLALVQGRARAILAGSPPAYGEGLLDLDRMCIARNLSPGGSADLLALALFLGRTEAVWLDSVAEGKGS